jgi:hypothetical protein
MGVKISQLPAAISLDGDELLEIVQDAISRRVTIDEIAARAAIGVSPLIEVQLSCSDLSTELEAASNAGYFRAPRAFTITAVRASLLVTSSSGDVVVNIKKNGATILSTKITVDAGDLTSVGSAAPPVLASSAVADDDLISIDIDSPGADAKGLVVTILGTRT